MIVFNEWDHSRWRCMLLENNRELKERNCDDDVCGLSTSQLRCDACRHSHYRNNSKNIGNHNKHRSTSMWLVLYLANFKEISLLLIWSLRFDQNCCVAFVVIVFRFLHFVYFDFLYLATNPIGRHTNRKQTIIETHIKVEIITLTKQIIVCVCSFKMKLLFFSMFCTRWRCACEYD